MTEKELREIKRRFRPERSNIPRIVGCFVNGNKQIIAKINQSLLGCDPLLTEKLLGVMKRTLSGGLGTNLIDMPFSTKQVLESEEHKLLTAILKSGLKDEDALNSFYSKVIESVGLEDNFVILLANDVYDVPSFGKSGDAGDSTESFSYIICAVCPVKNMPEALSFKENDSLFHLFSAASVLSSPELGFMFPTFEDRKTNIYNALFYTRSIAESYPEFTESIFASLPPMPAKAQKAAFSQCLTEALAEECSYELVRSVHAQVAEMIEAHKESKEPEPLTVTKETVKSILADCGVADERLEKLGEVFEESFGANAEVSPQNILSVKKFELTTPEVSVKVDPDHKDLVSTQVINDVKYLMIKVTSGVQVNGIDISLD